MSPRSVMLGHATDGSPQLTFGPRMSTANGEQHNAQPMDGNIIHVVAQHCSFLSFAVQVSFGVSAEFFTDLRMQAFHRLLWYSRNPRCPAHR